MKLLKSLRSLGLVATTASCFMACSAHSQSPSPVPTNDPATAPALDASAVKGATAPTGAKKPEMPTSADKKTKLAAAVVDFVPADAKIEASAGKDGVKSFFLTGNLPNGCYTYKTVEVNSKTPTEHDVHLKVEKKVGMCTMMMKPVMAKLPLDKPTAGEHTFQLKSADGQSKEIKAIW